MEFLYASFIFLSSICTIQSREQSYRKRDLERLIVSSEADAWDIFEPNGKSSEYNEQVEY